MHDFQLHQPATLADAFALLETYGDDARLLSGGTALVLQMKQRFSQPGHVVSLRRLPGLSAITATEDGGVQLGALCTQRKAEISPLLAEKAPLAAQAYRQVATPRIRSMATIGGGLAHGDPNQDPPPALIALNATAILTSAAGPRTVPVADLFRDYFDTDVRPGEIITGLIIPPLPAGAGTAYLKFLPRTADDYATVSAAAVVIPNAAGQCREARLALGSVGLTPLPATAAADLLRGQPLTAAHIRAAAEVIPDLVDPLDDHRGSADYKREMAAVFTRRALTQAAAAALPNGELP